MQPDDISSADLGQGYRLQFQEARGGSVVRAVIKNVLGQIVATGVQVSRSEASKSRFDATSKFFQLTQPHTAPMPQFDPTASREEGGDEDFGLDEEEEDEDEDEEEDEDFL